MHYICVRTQAIASRPRDRADVVHRPQPDAFADRDDKCTRDPQWHARSVRLSGNQQERGDEREGQPGSLPEQPSSEAGREGQRFRIIISDWISRRYSPW